MLILRRVAIVLIALLALVGIGGAIVYVDGASLPVDHSVSVTGTIAAPQVKVFARIADVAAEPGWRPSVKAVTMLPAVNGPQGPRAHWIEDLGRGETMTFLADYTAAPNSRDVVALVPGDAYGGTWSYELSPGPSPGATTLKITETGFIHPPIDRFMVAHVFGPTHNLDRYMKDLQASTRTL